jgi:hypothetical protein
VTRAVGIVAFSLLASCAKVLDIEDYPYHQPTADSGTDTSVADTGPTFAAPECRACADLKCGASERACWSDSRCATMLQCLSSCKPSDPACRYRCEQADTATATSSNYLMADRCRRGACVNECYGFGGFGAAAGAGCNCLDTECGEQFAACVASGECERMGICTILNGYSPAAAYACYAKHVTGADPFFEFRKCFMSACATCPLNGGGVYQCSGEFIYPKPKASRIAVTLDVTTPGLVSEPVPNVVVTACDPAQCAACGSGGSFIATSKGDDKGVVTLDLPTGFDGFRGCMHIAAPPEFTDTLYYFGRPLTQNERIPVPIVSRVTKISEFVVSSGIMQKPGYGTIVFIANDCVVTPSTGVSVRLDSQEEGTLKCAYFQGFDLRADVKSTGLTGAGVCANVVGDVVTTIHSTYDGVERNSLRVWVRSDTLAPDTPRLITAVIILPRAKGS